MMFIMKDVAIAIGKERNYDENNKQKVYQSITSFKDQYDDVKMRHSFLGKSLTTLTASEDLPRRRS